MHYTDKDSTRNLDDYKAAWQYHIDQLAKLAIPARIDYDRYRRTKVELEVWLQDAITNLYKEPNR